MCVPLYSEEINVTVVLDGLCDMLRKIVHVTCVVLLFKHLIEHVLPMVDPFLKQLNLEQTD